MYLITRWILFALAIMLTAWIIPGISISSFISALFVVVIMALINLIVKPILLFVTLPINFLTLGLFTLVINALLFMLAGYLAPGFTVNGFWSALFGSIVLSLISYAINMIGKNNE